MPQIALADSVNVEKVSTLTSYAADVAAAEVQVAFNPADECSRDVKSTRRFINLRVHRKYSADWRSHCKCQETVMDPNGIRFPPGVSEPRIVYSSLLSPGTQ